MSARLALEIVFVRHGRRTYAREFKHNDANDPLDQSEHQAIAACRGILENEGVRLSRVFVSRYQHAQDTARILCNKSELLSKDGTPVEIVPELTPKSGADIDGMFARIESRIAPPINGTFLFVGHEPRLRQLITQFTGVRLEPLDYLDMVHVVAGCASDLRLGRANVDWRYPVRNTSETELRQKVMSKMTVATFLAGFTFTSLGVALSGLNKTVSPAGTPPPLVWFDYVMPYEWHIFINVAALLLLSLSLGLFVGAIYVYDQLAMPRGLWDSEGKDSLWFCWFRPSKLRKNLKKNGYVYAHMVMAWSRLFTPAVGLAAVGFGLLLAARSVFLAGLYLLALTLAAIWYGLNKPKVGFD
jgi:phosphohistidine phosphatase SixA